MLLSNNQISKILGIKFYVYSSHIQNNFLSIWKMLFDNDDFKEVLRFDSLFEKNYN